MKAIIGFGMAACLFASLAGFCVIPALFLYSSAKPIYENGQESLFTTGELRIIYLSVGAIFASLAVVFAIDTLRAVRRRRETLPPQ